MMEILNIVMQAQISFNREAAHSEFRNRHNNKQTDFPNAINCKRENRIMIIKSLSVDHSQSLCVKSLLHKQSHSSLAKSKVRRRLFSQQPAEKESTKAKSPRRSTKDVEDCVQQLRHYRNLQKSDIFLKINEIERKISRQVRSAQKRERRRYMGEFKGKKANGNHNSINLSQISNAIKVKHIQNKEWQRKDFSHKLKLNTCTSFHQRKLLNMINNRFFKGMDSNSLDISRFVKFKKTQQGQKEEEFSAWKTEYDPDF